MLRLHPFLLVSSSLCFAVAPAGLAGCGARVEADLPLDDAGTPGVDATADAAPEASPDADAAPTVGLGSACDGVGDNPADCSGTLTCYQGDAQRGDDPTRWPGGYCTRSCQQDSQCTSVGGVCSGGGGFVLFYVPNQCREQVKDALRGLTWVPFKFDTGGSQIIFYSPEQDYAELDRARAGDSSRSFRETFTPAGATSAAWPDQPPGGASRDKN